MLETHIEKLLRSIDNNAYSGSNEKFRKIFEYLTDLMLRVKKKHYFEEGEIRLVQHFETQTSNIKVLYDELTKRNYINLPIERNELIKSITRVYVKDWNYSEVYTLSERLNLKVETI